jgi:hypothetical protein
MLNRRRVGQAAAKKLQNGCSRRSARCDFLLWLACPMAPRAPLPRLRVRRLLWPVLRRMRQRPGMVGHLTEIAAIEPATSRGTPDVMLRFLGHRPPKRPAPIFAARNVVTYCSARSVRAH